DNSHLHQIFTVHSKTILSKFLCICPEHLGDIRNFYPSSTHICHFISNSDHFLTWIRRNVLEETFHDDIPIDNHFILNLINFLLYKISYLSVLNKDEVTKVIENS